LLGGDVTNATSRTLLEDGVGHIPEDRHRHGMVTTYSVADNLVLSTYYHNPFARGWVRNDDAIDQNAEKLVKEFDVRTPSIETMAGKLSGGNQQKVVVAREFSRPLKLLIASQPTRGLDVGSIEFIHKGIIRQRDEGTAVLLVSAELDEILALADRIAVMFKGNIIATLPATGATREGLGLLMAGVTDRHGVSRTSGHSDLEPVNSSPDAALSAGSPPDAPL
jgi:simple sugar transport system ATP-binding protein